MLQPSHRKALAAMTLAAAVGVPRASAQAGEPVADLCQNTVDPDIFGAGLRVLIYVQVAAMLVLSRFSGTLWEGPALNVLATGVGIALTTGYKYFGTGDVMNIMTAQTALVTILVGTWTAAWNAGVRRRSFFWLQPLILGLHGFGIAACVIVARVPRCPEEEQDRFVLDLAAPITPLYFAFIQFLCAILWLFPHIHMPEPRSGSEQRRTWKDILHKKRVPWKAALLWFAVVVGFTALEVQAHKRIRVDNGWSFGQFLAVVSAGLSILQTALDIWHSKDGEGSRDEVGGPASSRPLPSNTSVGVVEVAADVALSVARSGSASPCPSTSSVTVWHADSMIDSQRAASPPSSIRSARPSVGSESAKGEASALTSPQDVSPVAVAVALQGDATRQSDDPSGTLAALGPPEAARASVSEGEPRALPPSAGPGGGPPHSAVRRDEIPPADSGEAQSDTDKLDTM